MASTAVRVPIPWISPTEESFSPLALQRIFRVNPTASGQSLQFVTQGIALISGIEISAPHSQHCPKSSLSMFLRVSARSWRKTRNFFSRRSSALLRRIAILDKEPFFDSRMLMSRSDAERDLFMVSALQSARSSSVMARRFELIFFPPFENRSLSYGGVNRNVNAALWDALCGW